MAGRHLEQVSIPVGRNESAEELGCAPCDRRCLFFLAKKVKLTGKREKKVGKEKKKKENNVT